MKQAIKKLFFKDGDIDYLFSRGILKGLRFTTNPMHKIQRILGLDEREIELITRNFTSRAKSAIDVGANDGWYTLFFASIPTVKHVIACEPEDQYTNAFLHNLEINPTVEQGKIKVIRAFVGTNQAGNYVTIDELTENLPEPVLLKIDVDGGEVDVLESAQKTLVSKKTFLIIETHSPQLEKDCATHLQNLGFKVTIVKNAWYRSFIKDLRPLEQNRWLYAEKV